jgi:pimeloyl-ACP methyl ester carboxylesterase
VSETIHHGRVALTLHTLREATGDGPRLLLLHALFGSSADWRAAASSWPGAAYALDFSGHGESDWLPGRGYSPEIFAAEADLALAAIGKGPVHLAGAGVGAYVALLLAGARQQDVRGALLLPGEGLVGGGALPSELGERAEGDWLRESAASFTPGAGPPDPLVRRCSRDIRPCYYAQEFSRAAGPLLVASMPETPPWLETALEFGQASRAPGDDAQTLDALARL